MLDPDSKVFDQVGSISDAEPEQQRLFTLNQLGLLEADSTPIFEEATQTAAHFLNAPICTLGLIDQNRLWFKSAVGLSRIGLMNDLASSRQLPRYESFCNQVVESRQPLAIADTSIHPQFARSVLVHRYGIRAYLGVPLRTSSGYCLGTLAIMDLACREFTSRDIEMLEMTARWCMSEFERNHLLKQQQLSHLYEAEQASTSLESPSAIAPLGPTVSVKSDLIAHMTQELRTPLTSILGMASVLTREVYGPLTDKQKEYMGIVHTSGQYLLTLVNEILELGALNDTNPTLSLSSVDIEMLCQQALKTLEQAAQRREQELRLTVEPGRRIWLLDKDKVRQMIYHLIFSVIQASSADSIIRIHVSRKTDGLNIMVWTTNPWLGDGFPQDDLSSSQMLLAEIGAGMKAPTAASGSPKAWGHTEMMGYPNTDADLDGAVDSAKAGSDAADALSLSKVSRQSLGLMLSRQLAEMHGGQISLQGATEIGYRYVISLPYED